MRSTKRHLPSEADIFHLSQQLAHTGGDMALAKFRSHDFSSRQKVDASYVTSADIAIEDELRTLIHQQHPNHSILGEEQGLDSQPNQHCWNIDPLDGTHNFMFGVPVFGTLVNVSIDDELLVSSAYDPNNDKLFSAWRGKGAFINGTPFRIDAQTAPSTIAGGVLVIESGKAPVGRTRITSYLAKHVSAYRSFRKFGCILPAFALAASGYLSAIIMFGMEYFEIATLGLFLKESGYTITNEIGQPWSSVHNSVLVAAPPHIHADVMATLTDI